MNMILVITLCFTLSLAVANTCHTYTCENCVQSSNCLYIQDFDGVYLCIGELETEKYEIKEVTYNIDVCPKNIQSDIGFLDGILLKIIVRK